MIKKISLALLVSVACASSAYAKDLICVDVGHLKGSIMSSDRNYVAMQDGLGDSQFIFAIDPDSSTVEINDGNPIKLNKVTNSIFERTVLLPGGKGTSLTMWTLSPKDKKVFFNENNIGENGSVKAFVGDIISYKTAPSCFSATPQPVNLTTSVSKK